MQIDTAISKIQKPSDVSWIFSILLATVVVVSGIGFFISNHSAHTHLDQLDQDLASRRTEIATLSNDRQVVITKIVQSNVIRPSLDLNNLVNNFRTAATKANVRLQGFTVRDDTISTNLISTVGDTDGHSDAVATIVKMMRDYAAGQKSFGLEPILAISGDPSRRTTSIQFHVISQLFQ